jgi:hypothetical protein
MTKAPVLRIREPRAHAQANAAAHRQRATVGHLIDVIERYETLVRRLVAGRGDAELYARLGQELDEIRRCCARLPELSVPWVMLLIAHAELIHCAWQGARNDATGTRGQRKRGLEGVLAPAQELRAICLRLGAG